VNPSIGQPDQHTLKRFRAGDIAALSAVFKLYGPRVYRLARRMMGNQPDAEDATQEIFLRAFQQADKFHGRSGLYTWLYRLAVRHCLNLIKQQSRRNGRTYTLHAQTDWPEAGTTPSPLDAVVEGERGELIDGMLQALPAGYRACLLLREVEGLSYAEIAELLAIPPGTVMSRLARARQALRQRFLQSDQNPRAGGNRNTTRIVQSSEARNDDQMR
jgi:RNA polymerase sigma-70 factor (ECF subfamily)